MIKKIPTLFLLLMVSLSLPTLLPLSHASAETKTDTKTKTQPILLVWGDSLSAAYGIPVEKGWVSLLQTRLGDQAKVINASISGETTQGGVVRLAAALDQYQPDIMLIELGGNDGLRGIRTDVMQKNMTVMIEMAQKQDVKVALLGIKIPPNYGKRYTEKFEKVFTDLADQYQLSLVPFILEGIASDYDLMQADGIHPNVKAQMRLLDNVMPVVKETLH